MQDDLLNHLTSFDTSLSALGRPDSTPVWQGQAPLIFEEKVAEATTMVEAIQDTQKNQEAGIGGSTEEKVREENELEAAAYLLAQAQVLYFQDHGQETEAGALNLTPTNWAEFRDQALLAKSQLVIDSATGLTTGPSAVVAAKYGITPAAVTGLTKERADYDAIVNAPSVAIAIRKALTKGFRPAISLTEKKFKDLDKLILQFGGTPAGKTLIAVWQNARIIKDAGHGPATPPVPPAPVV